MEMSDLKCLETIRTRHSLLNIFKHCYFEIKLHYKKYTVMSFQIMSLQMSVLCQYFTSFASVASWLWLLNISRHVSCQFGSIYHGSKLEQGGREQIASSKMFKLFL